jgi:hypothetical protein
MVETQRKDMGNSEETAITRFLKLEKSGGIILGLLATGIVGYLVLLTSLRHNPNST